MEVRQYRILLRSRLEEYDAALDDVVWVRDHIEKRKGMALSLWYRCWPWKPG
ncbi:MAG: hypothetical protein R3E89_18085 [Thiolinea sp.]